jgi:hypothetical protein
MFYPCFFCMAKKERKNNSDADKLILNRSGIINTKTNGNLIQRLQSAYGESPVQILAFSRKLLRKIYENDEICCDNLAENLQKNSDFSLKKVSYKKAKLDRCVKKGPF